MFPKATPALDLRGWEGRLPAVSDWGCRVQTAPAMAEFVVERDSDTRCLSAPPVPSRVAVARLLPTSGLPFLFLQGNEIDLS